MQIKNLVVNKSQYKIHLYRLCQLAYNIGQLYHYIKNNRITNEEIDKDVFRFVNSNNLSNGPFVIT